MDCNQGAPIVVGKITAQYGVKGWVKVFSYTRPVEQIFQYECWLCAAQPTASEWQSLRLAETAQQAKKLFAKLAGIDDRDSAHWLVGKWLAIQPAQLARLSAGEYYWSDLIGLSVVTQQGVELGIVEHLMETGANDVLAVRDARRERLLPWSPQVIVAVDIAARCMRVNWHADD